MNFFALIQENVQTDEVFQYTKLVEEIEEKIITGASVGQMDAPEGKEDIVLEYKRHYENKQNKHSECPGQPLHHCGVAYSGNPNPQESNIPYREYIQLR